MQGAATHLVRKADIVGLQVGDARGLGVGQDCEREKRRGWQRKYDKKRRAKQTGVIYEITCKQRSEAYRSQRMPLPWRSRCSRRPM